MTEKPNWLFKPVSVDNLEAIQVELITILYKEIPNFDNDRPTFHVTLRENIEFFAPLYTKFIESFGILDRWTHSAIITTNADYKFPIHVDNLGWEERCYGLNLPLINCEESFTVFYDAIIDPRPMYGKENDAATARLIRKGTIATEIDRFPASQPAWVNTSIPHNPITLHNKPRAVISARFFPEVHELFNK